MGTHNCDCLSLSPLFFFLKWGSGSFFFVECIGSVNVANAEILRCLLKYLRYAEIGFAILLLVFWPELISRIAQCFYN